MKILLTGATGYVGSCLLSELERRGVSLRALTRRPGKLVGSQSGRIVEAGSHAELLAQGGLYADLWQRQTGDFLAAQ